MIVRPSPVRFLVSGAMLAGGVALLLSSLPDSTEGPQWAGEGYSTVELKFLGNQHVFSIIGLNDLGHVAGSGTGKDSRFVAQILNGPTERDLPVLPGYLGSRAYGLNNRDRVVGTCYKRGASYSLRPTRGCVWNAGVPRELPPLAGLPCSRAWALNDDGLIVGTSYKPESEARNAAMLPTLWMGGNPKSLPLPKGAVQGEARKVNSKGDIIGTATSAEGVTFACMWRNGHVHPLPPLPGGRSTSAAGLNDVGMIVGLCDGRPVTWKNGRPQAMPNFAGAPSLSPVDIDNEGNVLVNDQAKPVNDIDDDPSLPLLYRPSRGYVRVAHLLPSGNRMMFVKGLALNRKGQIAVGAMIDGNRVGILVLTPPRQANSH